MDRLLWVRPETLGSTVAPFLPSFFFFFFCKSSCEKVEATQCESKRWLGRREVKITEIGSEDKTAARERHKRKLEQRRRTCFSFNYRIRPKKKSSPMKGSQSHRKVFIFIMNLYVWKKQWIIINNNQQWIRIVVGLTWICKSSTHKCLQKMEIDHLPNCCRLLQVTAEED